MPADRPPSEHAVAASDEVLGAVSVAVAQFAPGADREANLEQVDRLAHAAAARGAELLVLPEYAQFFGGTLSPAWLEAAETLDGPFVTTLGAIAREYGMHVAAGMLEAVRDGRAGNTIVVLDADGVVVATHRKIHLYDAFGHKESAVLQAGDVDRIGVFALGGLTFGVQTCYDIRFPEVSRRLVDAGADVLLVPSEWVPGPLKEHHWRTLLTARAIENTSYVVAADQIPPAGIGVSLVLDPAGVELVALAEESGVALATLERARIDAVREQNPALRLRRFHVEPGAPGGRAASSV